MAERGAESLLLTLASKKDSESIPKQLSTKSQATWTTQTNSWKCTNTKNDSRRSRKSEQTCDK